MSRIDMLELFKENEEMSCTQEQMDVLYSFLNNPELVVENIEGIVEVYNTLEIYDELDREFSFMLEYVEDTDLLINTIMSKITYFNNNNTEWDFILASPEYKKSVLKYIDENEDNFILFNNILSAYTDYYIKHRDNRKSKNSLKLIKYMSKKGISDGNVTYKLNKEVIKNLKDDRLSAERIKYLCSEDINDLRYVGKLVH